MEMDRATFINLAPEYYMLAFFIHFEYPLGHYSEVGLVKDFTYTSEDQEEYCYVENEALRAEALRLLQKHNAITVIHDPFGPTLWKRGEGYDLLEDMLQNSPASAFYKARVSGDRRLWLTSALLKVNRTARELRITDADFAAEAPDEWAPITIDQNEPSVQKAVQELRAATEAVEGDNGYAVTHSQERDQVVQDLKGGLEKLKSDTVSLGWLRRTVQALKTASLRFANTTKAPMIDGRLLKMLLRLTWVRRWSICGRSYPDPYFNSPSRCGCGGVPPEGPTMIATDAGQDARTYRPRLISRIRGRGSSAQWS